MTPVSILSRLSKGDRLLPSISVLDPHKIENKKAEAPLGSSARPVHQRPYRYGSLSALAYYATMSALLCDCPPQLEPESLPSRRRALLHSCASQHR